MPPQRRQREYETAVDPDALHIDEGKVTGFGDKRSVIKDAELEALRSQAQQAETLREQLEQALAQQGQGNSALAVQDGSLMVQGFQFSPTGLIAPEDFTVEAWEQIGLLLNKLEGSIQWLIGDWLVYGGQIGWGDIPRVANALGRDETTLHNYSSISRKVQFSLRSENLSYNHHVLVAPYLPKQQAEYLHYALHGEDKPLSVARFREWIKQQSGEQAKTPALSAYGSTPVPKPALSGLEKLSQRDPLTYKPKDKISILEYAAQVQAWLDDLVAKARS